MWYFRFDNTRPEGVRRDVLATGSAEGGEQPADRSRKALGVDTQPHAAESGLRKSLRSAFPGQRDRPPGTAPVEQSRGLPGLQGHAGRSELSQEPAARVV